MNENNYEKIHTESWDAVFPLMEKAKDGKSYVCPYCGKGHNGDGLQLNPKTNRLHCFGKCGKEYDQIDIVKSVKGLSDADAAQYVFSLYGIHTAPYQPGQAVAMTDEEIADKAFHQAADDIRNSVAPQNISNAVFSDYLKSRGLSWETAEHFNLGFLPNWQHPEAKYKRMRDGKPPISGFARLIIPTGEHSYIARAVLPDDTGSKYFAVGAKTLFNASVLPNSDVPVFIVEGEIDAMSFYEIGQRAVALGSVSNAGKFLDFCKAEKNKIREPLILALDNDQAGARATAEIVAGLKDVGVPFYEWNPYGDYKDANEALTQGREGFIKSVRCAERKTLDDCSNAAYLQSVVDDYANARPPVSTGLWNVDRMLNGGLRPGLIFIGGVSSVGKTAFAMQILDSVARHGNPVLVFALEMYRRDLIARSISRESAGCCHGGGVSQTQVQDGFNYSQLPTEKYQAIQTAISEYSKYAGNITVYENSQGNLRASDIVSRIERFCRLTGQRPVVLVDYLQIIAPPEGQKDDNIRLIVNDAICRLKGVASKYELPIIVISALNRENYVVPLNLAAFKESGNIEYSADVLLGIQFSIVNTVEFAKLKYEERLAALQYVKQQFPRKIEIAVLKQRNGRCDGSAEMDYYPTYNLFRAATVPEEYSPEE